MAKTRKPDQPGVADDPAVQAAADRPETQAGGGPPTDASGLDAPAAANGPDAPTDVQPDTADQAVAVLEQKLDELRDRLMRALAEAENARKRAERDRKEAEKYGGSRLARDMLPVYDNLKRALNAASEEQRTGSAAMFEGIELTMRELVNVFGRHGIEPVAPAIGDRFDPALHQAMFETPVQGTKAGDIIQVMQDGFTIHDRLLRPAHVGVSSAPTT